MNGLMLACCRGVYSVAARGKGPATHMFSRVDEHTNMPNNSAVMGLLLCGFWGLYFYLSNLAGTWSHKTVFTGTIFESVPFLFDPTELPIITIYALYIPVFIQWIRKQKGTLRLAALYPADPCHLRLGLHGHCLSRQPWHGLFLVSYRVRLCDGARRSAQPQNAAHRAGRWRLSRFALMRNRVPSASERCGGDSAYMNE